MAFSSTRHVARVVAGRRVAQPKALRRVAAPTALVVRASLPAPQPLGPEDASPQLPTPTPNNHLARNLIAGAGLTSMGAVAFPLAFGGGNDGPSGPSHGGNGGNGGGDGSGAAPEPREQFLIAAAADEEEEEEEVVEEEEEEEASAASGTVDEDEEGAGAQGSRDEDDEEAPAGRRGQTVRAAADDDDDSSPANPDEFFCLEIAAVGLPEGKGIPTADELFAALKCQPGFVCTRQEMSEDLKSLMQTQLFENVTARTEKAKGNKGKYRIVVTFQQRIWPPLKSFRVVDGSGRGGILAIPTEQVERVMNEYKKGGSKPTDMSVLALMRNTVEGWYADRGYGMAYVTTFDGLDSGHVIANVVEGKVTKVNLVPVDENGNPAKQSGLDLSFVRRELRDIIKVGDLYSVEDSRKALKELMQSGLFENMQVLPKQSPTDETKVELDVMVKERPARTAEVECEWGIAPNDRGRPTLSTIVPGGNLVFEHRNLGGNGTQLSAQLNTQNFLQPEDLSFNVTMRRPYVKGYEDSKKTALSATAFNARKLSPVFTSDKEEVPPVFVDRTGAKITVSESYSRNSKGSLSLVLEQVDNRDDGGALVTHGQRMGSERQELQQGPPTSLSGTGQDRVAFLQADLVRDATYFKGCQLVGERDIFTVEQGLGLGSGFPVFNRSVASMTRFLEVGALPVPGRTPAVFVAHAKAGAAIGDVASYDYFTLGGPFSCRGYNMGELGAARRFLELGFELRYPLPRINQLGYAFWEAASDLGSSKELRGNPTEFYRRNGSGVAYGAGVKLGPMRIEYARDCNRGKGSMFVRFGERF